MIDVKSILKELSPIQDMAQLDAFFQKYLGKSGSITLQFKNMGELSPEAKKKLGQELTEAKNQVTEAYEAKEMTLRIEQINEQLKSDIVDGSLDTETPDHGSYSLLANIRREVEEIFKSL